MFGRRKEAPSQPKAGPDLRPPPPSPTIEGSSVDLAMVYQFGQLTPEECDRVARASGLLATLPSQVPLSHKKQVVDATCRAFDVSEEAIVEAASRQLAALEDFLRASQAQTQQHLDKGKERIAQLEAEIVSCRQVQDVALKEQEARARQLNAEMLKVEHVLKFFAGAGDLAVEIKEVDDDYNADEAETAVGPAPAERKKSSSESRKT